MSAALLHSNAGAFERAIAEAMTDELPVPIRQIMDPATTPSEFLPFLAAHRSVDLWFEDWPEDRKRQMVAEAADLAKLVGTRAAAGRFLAYVDAQIVHKVSYPATRPIGHWALGIHPIAHPPFKARFLVKVDLKAHRDAFIIGKSAIGFAALVPPSDAPLRRARTALALSKAPETLTTVSFAHRVRRTLDDGYDLNSGHVLGSFKDRSRL